MHKYPTGRPVLIHNAQMPGVYGTVLNSNRQAVCVAFGENDWDWFSKDDVHPVRLDVARLRVIEGGKNV